MSVSIEFVGGPKDGELHMIESPIPEINLHGQPTGLAAALRSKAAAEIALVPSKIVYRRRAGRPRRDGVLIYDFAGFQT